MFQPNRRYGNPEAFRALTRNLPIEVIARQLRRHPRTIRDWQNGKRRVPYWVIDLLEAQHQLAVIELRRMGFELKPYALRTSPRSATVAPASASSDCHAGRVSSTAKTPRTSTA